MRRRKQVGLILLGLRGAALSLLLCSNIVFANQPIQLQLRWHHQFQFAGYYMALEQGYYRDAGLDVTLLAGAAGVSPLQEVLSQRAHFAVASSGALLAYLQGKPVVAMAAIFQHSPSIWLMLEQSDIYTVHDLATKKLELIDAIENIELLAIFAKEGIDINQLQLSTSAMRLDSLLSGEADAINAYVSNEPFALEQMGVAFRSISPSEYGVNFYRDILVSHADWVRQHPTQAKAFVDASLAGWKYAFNHVDATIAHIIKHYAPAKTAAQLQFEAATMRKFIMPELVEVGHMNPGRWQQIAQMFRQLGMIDQLRPLDDFIYTGPQADEIDYQFLLQCILLMTLMLAVLGVLAIRFRNLATALQAEITRHADTEQQLVERNLELLQLASTDTLTGLANRRVIMQQAQAEIRRARRYQKDLAVMMLDIDHFKRINDVYGHAAGDKVLCEFASLCRQSIRDTDFAGRYGGEEFFILLPEVDVKTAILSAERLRMTVAEHRFVLSDGEQLNITCSIGLAMYLPDQDDLDKLLLRADQALYQAKHQGRNRCCVQH
ncbi:MAG: diguanylate cyclase [Rheinheimera sp.]|nr:diguanylate cyclase [Rheinheimera sp.]